MNFEFSAQPNFLRFVQITLGIAISVILILMNAFIVIPEPHPSNLMGQKRACGANMRNILGAVEMYNLDNNVPMLALDLHALTRGGYLRNPLTCPSTGEFLYFIQGDIMKDGRIACIYHGFVDTLSFPNKPENHK